MSVYRGLDLGGCHSACASSSKDEATLVSVDVNDLANRSTPSVVSIGDRNRLIGEAAEGQLNKFTKSTYTNIVSATLLEEEGNTEATEALKKRFAFGWELGSLQDINGSLEDGNLFAETEISNKKQLLGLFLKKILSLKHVKGETHEKICIGVPDQMKAVKTSEEIKEILGESLKIAGISSDLVELAYHSECLTTQWIWKYEDKLASEKKKTCLIVDVGYSQTTCTLFKVEYKSVEEKEGGESPNGGNGDDVESPKGEEGNGDASKSPKKSTPTFNVEVVKKNSIPLGVVDFIHQLSLFGMDYSKTKYGREIDLSTKRGFKLRTAMQKALKELSMLPDTQVNLECFFDEDNDFSMDLKRADLEKAMEPVIEKLKNLITDVIAAEVRGGAETGGAETEGGNVNNIDNVEIVGGGVRIPCIASTIATACNIDESKLCRGLDGSSAVATGACLRAGGKKFFKSELSEIDLAIINKTAEMFVEIENKMQEIEDGEIGRMDAMNKCETCIYESKNLVSSNKSLFENAENLMKELDDLEMWFFDNCDDSTITGEKWISKHEELKSKITLAGTKYYEQEAEKEAKLNEELKKLNEKRLKDEENNKEDHDRRNLPKAERLRLAEKQRLEGNDMFKAQSFQDAIVRYQKASVHLAKLFDCNEHELAEKNKIELSCHLNTAMCYMKGAEIELGDDPTKAANDKNIKERTFQLYKKVINSCDSALLIDKISVKALYRKSIALEKIGEFDKARKCVKEAIALDPENKELIRQDKIIERAQAIQKKKESKMYGKMFG